MIFGGVVARFELSSAVSKILLHMMCYPVTYGALMLDTKDTAIIIWQTATYTLNTTQFYVQRGPI
jgi:hypothetical protein